MVPGHKTAHQQAPPRVDPEGIWTAFMPQQKSGGKQEEAKSSNNLSSWDR